MKAPLAGVRVLELTTMITGPLAGMLLPRISITLVMTRRANGPCPCPGMRNDASCQSCANASGTNDNNTHDDHSRLIQIDVMNTSTASSAADPIAGRGLPAQQIAHEVVPLTADEVRVLIHIVRSTGNYQ